MGAQFQLVQLAPDLWRGNEIIPGLGFVDLQVSQSTAAQTIKMDLDAGCFLNSTRVTCTNIHGYNLPAGPWPTPLQVLGCVSNVNFNDVEVFDIS